MDALEGARLLGCGVAGRPISGESESGDVHAIVPFAGGILVGMIDGLGHGADAAFAARAAAAVLHRYPHEPPATLVSRCHEELRKTRGAVLSLASFSADAATMTWVGVGNVEGSLLRSDESAQRPREALLLRGGVVGYQLPALRERTLDLMPGDTLIFATDGIGGGFAASASITRDPQEIADDILQRFSKKSDDALVLVARYRGT